LAGGKDIQKAAQQCEIDEDEDEVEEKEPELKWLLEAAEG